jgi:hypothetical protein
MTNLPFNVLRIVCKNQVTNLHWVLQDVDKNMFKSMDAKILEILVAMVDEGAERVVLDEVAVGESIVADLAAENRPLVEAEQLMLHPVIASSRQ